MTELMALLITLPILGLLGLGLIPFRAIDGGRRWIQRYVIYLLSLQTVMAASLALLVILSGAQPVSISFIELSEGLGVGYGTYVDGATCLMLLMVSTIGVVVSRYSVRYLDGEATQGQYFRWIGFTLGAVSMMVVSGNLLLFMTSWVMTSFGLHKLLLHYRHREAAHRAAWTKFAISRIGDVFLLGALGLTFREFGSFELSSIFAAVNELSYGDATWGQQITGWLFVLGAITKSAQFPFHTWLPDTMETPTPVSALMHAGVVNAGGYLIIRMSPVVALAPEALGALAIIGGVTACFGGVVMMTQPSIKRALAYSTIAQMGFMMLQCGLGAFSAAMLHILAHSCYKAHAFLTSGNVIAQDASTRGALGSASAISVNRSIGALLVAAVFTVGTFVAVAYAMGLGVDDKPGGFALAFTLCLALTTWGWRLLSAGNRISGLVAVVGVGLLSTAYIVSYMGVYQLVGPVTPKVELSPLTQFIATDVIIAFCALFILHAALWRHSAPAWLESLRIHASNGFYIDALVQRLFASRANAIARSKN